MAITRRSALKILAIGSAAAAGATPAAARETRSAPPGAMGMLYDTTRCIGCKTCVVACKQANDCEVEPGPFRDRLYDAPVDLDANTKNVIKLYHEGYSRSYVKRQCMHCVDPACASACMLGSLHKDPNTGVVGYDPTYCVGCRYCQIACPFSVPKFQFSKAVPKIVKCELCRHRIVDAAVRGADGFTRYPKGQGPACCEVCPRQAVIYGLRDELLAEGKRRIAAHPGRYYQDRIYGETDGGGTQVVYLSHVPFEKIGLPALGERSVPQLMNTIQQGVYRGFLAPLALYAGLAAVIFRNRRRGGGEGGEGDS
jgi:Fe-S-cluster-containing dehydrogenase component